MGGEVWATLPLYRLSSIVYRLSSIVYRRSIVQSPISNGAIDLLILQPAALNRVNRQLT